MRTICIIISLFSIAVTGVAQSAQLESYVQEGITNSDALKQQQFQLQKNLYALEEAKGLFKPALSLNGQYTLAAGGRAIAIPIGDLLNPVYSTLNEITQTNQFPQLENVQENLNPNNFYDLKIRTTYPIINADIRYNKEIKEQQVDLQQTDIDIYKKELARNIRVAYFQYLQAQEATRIYQNALTLVRESLRVNQKLYENGMANPTVVNRAKNEVTKVEAQLTEAQNNAKNAAAYFNFLLNKPFDTPIAEDSSISDTNYAFPSNLDGTTENRDELRKLLVAQGINQTVLKMNEAYKIPKVNAFVDLGSQAFNFGVGNGSLYALGGVSIELPIYQGNRNKQKIKMAEMDVAAVGAQRDQVADQLALQLQTSLTDYESALRLFQSSRSQVESAQRYFDDMSKRYREGQVLYIEYLDARNELTTAELQQSINLSKVWVKWADVQRASGK